MELQPHRDTTVNKAEKAVSMARASPVVDHCSSQTSDEPIRNDGSRATIARQSTDLTMSSTLESLGTAMLMMQERQETLFEEVKVDSASKMAAKIRQHRGRWRS
jgi:hypothetical protein